MSSFEFLFLGWLFASQKMREMLCISRPEFALQTRAFQGYVRTSCYLHSFATLRNWLRQPLQSLPRFVNQILEIEPIIKIVFEERNEELELHNKNRRRNQKKTIMNTQSYRCQ